MLKVLGFVFLMRCLLFVASFLSIPIEIVAVLGSLVLLIWRWYYLRTNPVDILKKTPWHILIFAFSMYVIIYGLHNAGLTAALVQWLEPVVSQHLLYASFAMVDSFLSSPMSSIITCTYDWDHYVNRNGIRSSHIKTIYLANIIGSDIGSLLLPIGTLASLIWMYILKQNKIKVKWKDYLSVSLIVIPLTTVVTLFLLFYWVHLFFAL